MIKGNENAGKNRIQLTEIKKQKKGKTASLTDALKSSPFSIGQVCHVSCEPVSENETILNVSI